VIHVGDLHPSEVDDGRTTKSRTLTDCLRGLPFDEALAVADSALRHGFSARLLVGLAASAGVRGRRRCAGWLASPRLRQPTRSSRVSGQ
jgi:hypothetical protein